MAINNVTLPVTGEDLKTKLNEIIAEFLSTVNMFGGDGRIRFDDTTKHFHFEVKQPNNSWITKAEIGASIIVDAMRLIKGDKPTNIIPGEIAFYNKEVTLPDGSKSVRSHFVLENGDEYGFLVINEQTGEAQYRDPFTSQLVNVPIIYVDKNNVEITDISKIKFTGGVTLTKGDNKILTVDIQSGGDPKAQLTALTGDDRLPASAIKDLVQEQEVVSVDSDLSITKNNYLDYRYKTLSCVKDDDDVQNILLPEIKTVKGAADFTIVNSRTSSRIVRIKPYAGELIKDKDIEILNVFDSITLERPIKGTKWIVKSRNTDKMDGGEI